MIYRLFEEGNNEWLEKSILYEEERLMSKNLQPFSIVFMGICIILSSWLISQSLITNHVAIEKTDNEQNRYDFITIASDYFIIFDKQKGEYWMKIGSSDWEKQQSFSNPTE
ncbi:hypothetical protein AB1300_09845 [Lysinibacillus xylanilyticus]|uniref:Group-specific protein n=2 Tax=Lysinibacillus xylanilyticus TaxID=582475 RepID=A0ABV3VX10_9BACI